MPRWAVAAATLLLGVAPPAIAQDTRAATLEQQRAEKAKQVHPYQPGRIERALLYVEQANPLGAIAPHNGFFIQYGYNEKPIGSGIGVGGGFRHDLFDRRARILLEAGATWRHYRMLHADFSLPYLAGERAELGVGVSDRHDPEEDFYGLGAASLQQDRVSFLFDRRDLQARAVIKPIPGIQAGVRFGRMGVSVGAGRDSRFPSVEQRFTDATAPGLAVQPDYRYADLFANADTRDQPGNPRAGGYYGVTWRTYSDLDLDRYSFRTLDADLQQFIPIFDKKRVIALRARIMTTTADEGQSVPFYFRPTVGGSDSLRSVRDYRFRDSNALSMNAEYRWEAFSGLDMALFADWGTVVPHPADLDFDDLEHAYGIGFRFNTYKSVFLRLDVALAGAEAPRYFIKFSKAF